MSVKIKISYTSPEELETVKKALEGIIEPEFRKKAAGKEYKKHYITGKVKKEFADIVTHARRQFADIVENPCIYACMGISDMV